MSLENARACVDGLSVDTRYGVSAILKEAATTLRAGWVQHWFAMDEANTVVSSLSPSARKICLAAAVVRAQHNLQNYLPVPKVLVCGESARKILKLLIPPGQGYGLCGYNDFEGRSQEEVIDFVLGADRLVLEFIEAL